MKVLYVTTLHRTGGWLAEAFRADCAAEVQLVETVGVPPVFPICVTKCLTSSW